MKYIFEGLFTCALFILMVSCNNEKKEEVKEKKATVEAPVKVEKKTEISVGPDGGSVKTKDGKEMEVNKNGVKVGTKDVKVKLNTKDTLKH